MLSLSDPVCNEGTGNDACLMFHASREHGKRISKDDNFYFGVVEIGSDTLYLIASQEASSYMSPNAEGWVSLSQ
jgi:hypothetical protein